MPGQAMQQGRRHHHVRRNPAKAQQYRQSAKGILARQMLAMNPEHKAKLEVRRELLKRLHGKG